MSQANSTTEAGRRTAGDVTTHEGEIVLRFEAVEKNFGAVRALKGVSLDVKAGEVHAVVGENGAGKSTIMAIAAGELAPDGGRVEICGVDVTENRSPKHSRALGLTLAHQHPALLPDLTVAENLRLAVPRSMRPPWRTVREWTTEAVESWRTPPLDPRARVRDLSPDGQSVLELTKATVQRPKVLILDEPTENLSAEDVSRLHELIRAFIARGSGVVYISHRIGEVKAIADRVTVLRDGEAVGTFVGDEVSNEQIVNLIAGRSIESVFPDKRAAARASAFSLLRVETLTGDGFDDVSLQVDSGEIVGLAGIEGNGQSEVLRALAGLAPAVGDVRVGDELVHVKTPAAAREAGLVYIPRDRRREGLMTSLSVRENLTIALMDSLSRAGVMLGRAERQHAASAIDRYRIRAASMESDVDELSGGNQQKVLVSRVLDSRPKVVLADECTQGVDVGARAEIYGFLRSHVDEGAGALVVSSDFRELSGLCDRVHVMSRGRITAELSGGAVTERNIVERVLTASSTRQTGVKRGQSTWHRFASGEMISPLVLLLVILALGAVGTALSPHFLTSNNLNGLLTLFSAMAFAGIAQAIVIMTGGIDLSVGPLMGFLVVFASIVLPDPSSPGRIVYALALIVLVALAVGAINWVFIIGLKVQPMIATLITYTALQGFSLILRPLPAGTISQSVVNAVSKNVGFVPVSAVVAAVLAIALDIGLVRTNAGSALRAIGSRSDAAGRVGLSVPLVTLLAYVACSLVAVLAALLLMAQVQTGDPSVGTNYTLISITAVVLGGASVFGGRGSFVGALLGALLIEEIDAITGILNLSPAWQLLLLGFLTIVSVAIYSSIRVPSEYLRRLSRWRLRRAAHRPAETPAIAGDASRER